VKEKLANVERTRLGFLNNTPEKIAKKRQIFER
jgi:hypothetical protein